MHEEAEEIIRADFEDPIEFADLLQVLEDTAKVAGHDWSKIEAVAERKRQLRGGFLTGNGMVR